jgi:hypothetical protein
MSTAHTVSMSDAQRVEVIAALAQVDRRIVRRVLCEGHQPRKATVVERLAKAQRQLAYLEAGEREGRV